ncbi:MAG: inorganic diphosphatase, partial [Deltaproteobacteria bacterium]|nr:inorganic diphosphatase [Deltaproteobacteria bacterium]
DFKEYEVDGRTLGLGQVEVVNFHFFYERQQEIEAELKKLRQEKGYALAALLVTDIVEGTSLLLALGPQELPLIIGYPQQEENLYQARGVLSRKKQLVPHLLKIFKN